MLTSDTAFACWSVACCTFHGGVCAVFTCCELLQVGLNILGVVENMSGLQQPLASMRFMSQSAGDDAPRDVTQELLALLSGSTLDADSIVAQSDVFKPTKGGAEHMAADMGIPFLGRVPLDPALSLAGVPQLACLTSARVSYVTAADPCLASVV